MNSGVRSLKHGCLWTANKESTDGPEMKLIFGPSAHQSKLEKMLYGKNRLNPIQVNYSSHS